MARSSDNLTLTDDELAFFRLTCDLFPAPESPLRYLEEKAAEPRDPQKTFATLEARGLLNGAGSGAAQEVLDRLLPVSECNARVSMIVSGDASRDFYLAADGGVEYSRTDEGHRFGPLRTEAAVAAELAQHFQPSSSVDPLQLRMSAGDYLVFAVFCRDVRTQPESPTNSDAPMSVDEVLAYFDEPETKMVRTPSDETWQASIHSLRERGVLSESSDGFELDLRWHPLARQIVADQQHTVTRFDYLDEQWLVREVSIYPTEASVFRLGTEPDGSVAIEELSITTLADALAGVVGTLPNLLNPDAPPILRSRAAP